MKIIVDLADEGARLLGLRQLVLEKGNERLINFMKG